MLKDPEPSSLKDEPWPCMENDAKLQNLPAFNLFSRYLTHAASYMDIFMPAVESTQGDIMSPLLQAFHHLSAES